MTLCPFGFKMYKNDVSGHMDIILVSTIKTKSYFQSYYTRSMKAFLILI